MRVTLGLFLLLAVTAACGATATGEPPSPDAATSDGSLLDSGTGDVATTDVSSPDVSALDVPSVDVSAIDVALQDTAASDGPASDTMCPILPDAGPTDAGPACMAVDFTGIEPPTLTTESGPLPANTGGALPSGTYVMTQVIGYSGHAPLSIYAQTRSIWVFDGGNYVLAQESPCLGVQSYGGTFMLDPVVANRIDGTVTCGLGAGDGFGVFSDYTLAPGGGTFTDYDTANNLARVFTRH